MNDEMTFTLNSPLTEEEWDMIADVDFDHTSEITFHTKHGKEVVFVKRKTGEWIKEKSRGQLYQCSACGNYLDFRGVNAGRGSANYCPNCDARMEP